MKTISQILETQSQDKENENNENEKTRKQFPNQMVNFPCSVCEKPVAINHEAVCCDICNKWVHIRCNNICKKTYRCLKKRSNFLVS